ncbi:hypothetical protein V8G54_012499 [Vigna mungo]|uniref:Uncharacterized protein n=1 Tax=Vigna mungo TaxID=3915 RepID=A0AAQ3NUU8_VIGMU
MTFFLFCTGHIKVQKEDNNVDKTNEVGVLGQKIFITIVRCTSSLIFASIEAGISVTLVRPSLGQWIGKIVALLEFCNLRSNLLSNFLLLVQKLLCAEKLFKQNLELILACFTSIRLRVSSFSSGCAAGDLADPCSILC